MIFALLVFLAAFGIEGIGTYVSVVGLSALFAASPVVIVLSIALDYGKVIAVSFLYKHWSKIKWPMKLYMTLATAVLVSITSAGAFGFLSGEFQKAIADTGTQAIKIQTLSEEQVRLQKRKEEIDAQIAKVPDKNVKGRTQLIKQFGPEVNKINDRLSTIDKELPELKIQNVDKEVHVGPIIYVAKAFNTTPEEAVKWVILTIMTVFDPLAICLLIAGNFLIEQRKQKIKEPIDLAPEEIMIHPSSGNVFEDIGFPPDEANAKIEKILADQEVVKVEEPKITANQMELVPIEELQTPTTEPITHIEEQEERKDNSAKENENEEEAIITPTPASSKIVIKERDGRDVISLTHPRSTLEDVSSHADVTVADNFDAQSLRLHHHYLDEDKNSPPVMVGNPK